MINNTTCPLCNGNLLNEPIISRKQDSFWMKSCQSKIDHRFTLVVDINTNFISYFTISDRKNIFTFQPLFKSVFITKYDDRKSLLPQKRKFIPYFEPDFSDTKKLFNKLNTYLILI